MSQQLIQQFLNELDLIKKFSGSLNEQVIREAFKDLLKAWSKQNDLFFVAEHQIDTGQKTKIYVDGAVLHSLRVPLGLWEAKDTKDDLEEEIRTKFAKGYPQDNILFENSETAILIQNKNEVFRCEMQDTENLLKLLNLFFSYERQEIAEFRKAVAQFQQDLPQVLDALRERINDAYSENEKFKTAANGFLERAKETINPSINEADIREMLIQHILTEEIFSHVFNEGDFHRENNIAKELYALESEFFTGSVKKETLKSLETYYAAIRANAAQIDNHSEKQKFLKVIYEGFYKVYNPKAADRLGVVYTPNEIVRFMIEGADWLTQKHFGKALIDNDVEILDPATGTGTYICELLEYFRGQPEKLAHKYKNELHANEVAILPYYVANLNIEATYAAITGQFAEYPNLCFVDTLDNVGGLGIRAGDQLDMLAALSDENIERVKRQNNRKISVVIGNPPYNANQQNENDNNKNREYKRIDELIKSTYIKKSTAQKTKVYDMYSRFFRWATDRLHDDGVIAFVTNRSFIDSRTFDGFRRDVADEFSEIYVMDLGGDVRANPKLSGTKNNVFGIQTGVCISFMVKKKHKKKEKPECKVFYARRPEMDTIDDKLTYLASNPASQIQFDHITPSKRGNWINQVENEWDDLIAVADKKTKAAKAAGQDRAIFKLFSLGVVTARDEWVYSMSENSVTERAGFFIEKYADEITHKTPPWEREIDHKLGETEIKWTRALKANWKKRKPIKWEDGVIIQSEYRPFVRLPVYYSPILNEMIYQTASFAGEGRNTPYIAPVSGGRLDFAVFSGNGLPNYALYSLDPAQCLPRYRYSKSGEKIDNITDWALNKFTKHYGKPPKGKKAKPTPHPEPVEGRGVAKMVRQAHHEGNSPITKDDIFYYVYGVLHDPEYRETYAINLKREFPRIPFYPDFTQWAEWGKRLMDLHIGYEDVKPWPLERLDTPDEKAKKAGVAPKPMLRADKDNGIIRLDSKTQLSGIPSEVWDYKLGNRSGLEWILDQYKEKKPRDPTIREKFNTYRFADYKEKVIDLLMRVTRVSVETMEITQAMKAVEREQKKQIKPSCL